MTTPALVSIVTPAYNVGRFVRSCAASILGQSYPHLEWIVVDDGSTDDTRAILEEIAAGDPRVTLIAQDNAGIPIARNKAMARATGDYFAFIDADDLWHPRLLERCVPLMERHKLDFISFTLEEVPQAFKVPADATPGTGDAAVYPDPWAHTHGAYPADRIMGNKLYRRASFPGLSFAPALKEAEDVAFAWQVRAMAQRIGVIPDALYYYRKNADSISRQQASASRLRCIDLLLRELDNTYVRSGRFAPTVVAIVHEEMGKTFFKSFFTHMKKADDPALRQTARALADGLLKDGIMRPSFIPLRKRISYYLSRL